MTDYLIADTHFSHKRILEISPRPYASLLEHDEALIANWNQVVSDNDTVYHLGDLFLCPVEREWEIAPRLRGRKYLIKGNHDRRSDTRYRDLGFEPLTRLDMGKFILTHIPLPMDMVPVGVVNVHGHTHGLPHPELTRHICVSVECIGYRPIAFDKIHAQR